jgi:large subunit ribosomal protein L30
MPAKKDTETKTAKKKATKKTAVKKKVTKTATAEKTATKKVAKKKVVKKAAAEPKAESKAKVEKKSAPKASTARLRVRQVRSGIGNSYGMKRTLVALGLKHHQDEVELPDNPAVRGMLRKVHHLVRVDTAEKK